MKLDKQIAFSPFEINGIAFDLSHLNAHIVEFIQPRTEKSAAQIYKFYVTYSMHCFTKDYPEQSEEQKQQLMYHTQRESRPFCKIRYELSKNLPNIVQGLATAKIGFAGYDNFATVKIFDESTRENIYYKMTFVMYRFERKMRLHITSAYPIKEWEKLKPVGFFKIVHNLFKGKPLPRP